MRPARLDLGGASPGSSLEYERRSAFEAEVNASECSDMGQIKFLNRGVSGAAVFGSAFKLTSQHCTSGPIMLGVISAIDL